MRRRWTTKELEKNTRWRLAALKQIEEWWREAAPGEQIPKTTIIKRFAKLEDFIGWYTPDAPPVPFDPEDAAALIVLPRWKAARLAYKLGIGPKDIRDYPSETAIFNLDAFTPRRFK